MRIVLITPGTGTFYCGVCLRDEALAKALRDQGHEVESLPVYLPLVKEEISSNESSSTEKLEPEIFFGGINAYLQQISPLFRHSPRKLDKFFDRPRVLNLAAKMGEMTDPSKLGAMTLSMLQGESGRQHKELDRMIDYLRSQPPPDLICLATALQAGMIRLLKTAFPSARIACWYQGEDEFIDALSGGYAERCWQELRLRGAEADSQIVPSQYFRDRIATKMKLDPSDIQIIPNGIDLSAFPSQLPSPSSSDRIGYLARMCPDKGLDLLIDAFIQLHRNDPETNATLRVMGVMRQADEAFVNLQKEKLTKAGLIQATEFLPNISREEKISGLTECTLFSVPARYSEAFGLYVVEALAAGVPCVLPDHAAFPEIVGHQQQGIIYHPHDRRGLTHALAEALTDPGTIQTWRKSALDRARSEYDIHQTASALLRPQG